MMIGPPQFPFLFLAMATLSEQRWSTCRERRSADVEATAKAYLQTRGFKVDDGYSGLAVGAKGLDAIRRKPG